MKVSEGFLDFLRFTDADDGRLVSRQTHPADNTRFGWTDGLLAVINAVNVSLIKSSQVRPETNERQRMCKQEVRQNLISNVTKHQTVGDRFIEGVKKTNGDLLIGMRLISTNP